MVSLEQWRAAISCFVSSKVIKIVEIVKKNINDCETNDEALCRRETNRLNTRLCETEDETLCRRETNRLNMKNT